MSTWFFVDGVVVVALDLILWICFIDIVQFSVCTDEIIACYTSILCLLSWTHSAVFALQSLYSFNLFHFVPHSSFAWLANASRTNRAKQERKKKTERKDKERKNKIKNKYVDNKSWQAHIFGNDDKRKWWWFWCGFVNVNIFPLAKMRTGKKKNSPPINVSHKNQSKRSTLWINWSDCKCECECEWTATFAQTFSSMRTLWANANVYWQMYEQPSSQISFSLYLALSLSVRFVFFFLCFASCVRLTHMPNLICIIDAHSVTISISHWKCISGETSR